MTIPGEGFVEGEQGQQWKGVRCWRVGERRVIEAVVHMRQIAGSTTVSK